MQPSGIRGVLVGVVWGLACAAQIASAQTAPPKAQRERLKIAVAPPGWDTNFTWLQSRSGQIDKRPALEYLVGIDRQSGLGRHRTRCLTVRLPMPPVRPVRETFASYGSRQRDIMGKVHFASSTVHSPWTALRVRWVPLYCFPTLSLRAFAMYAVFPHSDYYALFDCLEGFGVSLGSRLPTVHPPSHPFQALPCSPHRTQSRML